VAKLLFWETKIMPLLDGDKAERLRLFGEDTCELVSAVEQSFDVRFTEVELVQAKTIGELARIISTKLKYPLTQQCLSAVMFYKLRAFIDSFRVPRAKISPATSLYELMPWKTRRRQWRRIQVHLNCVLPQLTWPVWLLALSLLIVGFVLYFLFGPKMLGALGAESILLGIIALLSVLVLIIVVLSPLARQFPRGCETFGDLAKLTLARNYAKVAVNHGVTSEKEVSQSLLWLIASETRLT
jgi:hypothetical protein